MTILSRRLLYLQWMGYNPNVRFISNVIQEVKPRRGIIINSIGQKAPEGSPYGERCGLTRYCTEWDTTSPSTSVSEISPP